MPLLSFIPEMYKDGFKELSSLTEETFGKIEKALLEVALASSVENLAANIIESQNDLNQENLEKIFLSTAGLIPFIEDETQFEEVADDIIQLTENGSSESFKNRLLILLRSKKILLASKVQDLVSETENVFLDCKIVTDVRPIFGLNLEEQPSAGIIMHNLHLHYQGGLSGQHQDIYLSLNSSDIGTIVDALIRADKKEESLRLMLSKIGMENLTD